MARSSLSLPLALLVLGISAGLLPRFAFAQTDSVFEMGLKPYGAYHGGDIDVINLQNLKLDVHAPLFSYPQRGKLHMGFTLRYSNPAAEIFCSYKDPKTGNCAQYLWEWIPARYGSVNAAGVQVIPDTQLGYAQQLYGTTPPVSVYSVVSPDGSYHRLTTGYSAGETIDATGVHFDSSTQIVIDSDGLQYNLSSGTVEDPNGNEITKTSTGWNDSLNRAIEAPPTIEFLNGTITGGTVTTDYSKCSGTLATAAAADWSIPGPAGGTTTVEFCWARFSVTVGTTSGITKGYSGLPYMLQSLVLPNNTTWTFEYDGGGNLSSVTLPTGGTISYTSGLASALGCGAPQTYPHYYPYSTFSRSVNANDGTGAHKWIYSGGAWSSGQTTITDPVGNTQVHSFLALETCSYYETGEQDYQGAVSQSNLLKTVTTGYSYSQGSDISGTYAYNVVPTSIKTTWPNNKVTEVDKTYDTGSSGITNGKVVTESDYDYGSSSKGTLLKKTSTSYTFQTNGSYQTANLLNLPSSVKVTNVSGYNCAETDYTYDTSSRLYSSGISTQHVSAPNSVRGNLSSATRQISSAPCQSTTSWTSSVTSYKNVYDTGEVYQSIDPLGNATTYTYDPAFAGAYVTKTQAPDTDSPSLAHHITQDGYDFNTGLHISHTDENLNPTTYAYDSMWRIQSVTPPAPEGAVTFTYTDTPGTLSVKKQQTINGTSSTTEYDLFDQMGRQVSHAVDNGQSSYDKSDTCYDARGMKSFVSYPYQTATWNSWPACPISQPGDTYAHDGIKRTTSVTHSDSTAVTYAYTGAATSVTDEGNGTRGVQKISQVDGMGRLFSVCEVTATTLAVGTDHTPAACNQDISGTGFLTTYTYDGLSNLTSVSQGSSLNHRTFTYDSLSRVITTTNPEAGTTCFGTWSGSTCLENYDADSNVLSRTRPAPNQSSSTTYVTASYTYDPLNRLRTKTYSDGTTPPVTLDYDETSVNSNTLANTIGRPSSEYTGPSTAVTSESILSYNAPGWTVEDIQCTPQNCAKNSYFTFNYGYDGVGDVTSSGNGVIFTYALSYSVAPKLTQITTNWFSPTVDFGTVISNVLYNAFGEPTSATLNDSIISENWAYDTRGRLQSDTAVASSTTLYSLTNMTYSGNSAVLAATDSVNGTWSSYTYDDFNRLATSKCTAGCPQSQSLLDFSYTYDRYGNRWQETLTAGGGSWTQPSYSFDANNRITSASGITFDVAGNIINDGIHSYTYDAENRIVQVDAGSTAVYAYDAEGRRVAKTAATGGGAFEYLFDLAGRAVTEMGAGTANINRSEIYGGGRHLATQDKGLTTTYFMHNDWLGTKRVASSLTGTVAETCTSLAYGDDLYCVGAQASSLHFTGQMRDAETNLTEFPARYYSPTQGRWYSPDWASAQVPVPYADLHNPQTLNLYDYVGGDPTNHADADGHLNFNPAGMADENLEEQEKDNQGRADAATAATQTQAAQNTPQYDPKKSGPEDPTNPGHPLSQNPVYKKASDEAWQTTRNGTAGNGRAEAGGTIEYKDGKLFPANKVNSVNDDPQTANHLHITTDDHTIAIYHVHGNSLDPKPSPGDLSPNTHVPDFVRSQRSLYVTIPGSAHGNPSLNDYTQLQ